MKNNITEKIKTWDVSRICKELEKFTYSSKISNEDLNTLIDEHKGTEEGDLAVLTTLVRELKERFSVNPNQIFF